MAKAGWSTRVLLVNAAIREEDAEMRLKSRGERNIILAERMSHSVAHSPK